MNLLTPEDEKITILHELCTLIVSGFDPVNIAGQIRNRIRELVSCDKVLLFTNDPANNCLTAANNYNHISSEFNNIIIKYDTPLAIELLIHKNTKITINAEHPVLPDMQTELLIPLKSPNTIIGCLYIARTQAEDFSVQDIKNLEITATCTAVFLERALWEKQLYTLQNTKKKNKAITRSFLESLQIPALIIDIYKDKTIQVNQLLLDMLGYDKDKLLSLPFSSVCKDYFSIRNIEPGVKQNFILNFIRQNGEMITGKISYTFMDHLDNGILLLLVTPEQQHAAGLQKNFWLYELFASLSSVVFDNVQNSLKNTAQLMLKMFEARYLFILRLSRNNNLLPLAGFTLQDNIANIADDEIQKNFNTSFFQQIAKSKKSFSLANIAGSPDSDKLEFLQNAGVQSFASVPLLLNNTCMGLMNIFCTEPYNWQQKDIIKLSSIAQISSSFIFSPLLMEENDAMRAKQDMLDALVKQFNSGGSFEAIIGNAAVKISKLVAFDYFSLSIFDENGNIDRALDLTHPDMVDKFAVELQQKAIPDCPLHQVIQNVKSNGIKKNNLLHPFRLPFSLPTHTSVVLVSGEKYLGNFAIGRLQTKPFTREEILLLKQTSALFSAAVSRYQLTAKSGFSQKTAAILQELNINFITKPDKKDILQKICATTQKVMDSVHCKAVFVNDTMKMIDLFNWMPDMINHYLSVQKIKNLLLEQKKTHLPTPLYTKDVFKELLCNKNTPDISAFFKPFIITPIFKNSQIHALLLVVFEKNYAADQNDLAVLQNIARQAENLFTNLELYYQALEKNDSQDNLVHLVTHELKSPLQTIKNFASLIKEDTESHFSAETEQCLDRMLVNLDNMENMLIDLLELAKLDKTRFNFTRFNSKEAVLKSIQTLEGLITVRQAEISIDNNLPEIVANETGMVHIFTNLISNALKYSKNDTVPQVKIAATENGACYEFTVADNGIGIAPQNREKIFELFYKNNDHPEDLSTGVGLAIVKKIVQNHNGEIWVESTPGKGSNFKFTLPKL